MGAFCHLMAKSHARLQRRAPGCNVGAGPGELKHPEIGVP